jgi:hypothetical protein
MEVSVKKTVQIDVKELVDAMSAEEIAEFCSKVAEKLDGHFSDRNAAAERFTDGLSELGCRFIAEVVTHHYMRQKEGSGDE